MVLPVCPLMSFRSGLVLLVVCNLLQHIWSPAFFQGWSWHHPRCHHCQHHVTVLQSVRQRGGLHLPEENMRGGPHFTWWTPPVPGTLGNVSPASQSAGCHYRQARTGRQLRSGQSTSFGSLGYGPAAIILTLYLTHLCFHDGFSSCYKGLIRATNDKGPLTSTVIYVPTAAVAAAVLKRLVILTTLLWATPKSPYRHGTWFHPSH